MPATGRSYEIEEMHWFRIADGRIREHWHVADLAGMFRQLGRVAAGAGRGGRPGLTRSYAIACAQTSGPAT